MSVRVPPPRSPGPKKESKDGADPNNALWRIPTWFKDLEPQELESLHLYHSELLRFNVRVNLISRTTERDADETHFADSIYASRLIIPHLTKHPLYDIGSGNGLPGIVLGILKPDQEVFLVESDVRKCEFLKHLIHLLKLKNCAVMNVRLETLKGADMRLAVSRGFATISKTVLLVNKSFPPGGKFFHLKGSNWSTEIAEIPSQLISVWMPELVGEYSLPVSQARRAVVCTKKA